MDLPRLPLPAAELLRQKTADILGDIRVVLVGKAVVGALRLQKGGVGGGVLRQRRTDAAVLGEKTPGGVERIVSLSPKAGRGQRRLPHGIFVGYRCIIPQFIRRVKIFRRGAGIFHRYGVIRLRQLRYGGVCRRCQLGQGTEAVLVQPVERVGAVRQRGVVQRRPAAIRIRLPHEAPQIAGGGVGHRDGEHRRLRPGGRSGGQVASRQTGGGIIPVAQGIHVCKDGSPAIVQPCGMGGVAAPAPQHRDRQQYRGGGAAPDAQGGNAPAGEGQKVQKQQRQCRQRHPPQGRGGRQHHDCRRQRQRRQAQRQITGAQDAAGAPHTPEGGGHRQQRRQRPVVLRRGKYGVDPGEHLLPCVQRGIHQRSQSSGQGLACHQQRGGAQGDPAQGREPRAAAVGKGRHRPGGQQGGQQRQP